MMNKRHTGKITLVICIILACFTLQIEVLTKKGINYEVKEYKIPLYLKLLNFYDRHYNYKWLVNQITLHQNSEKDKVLAIAKWVNNNIKKKPPGVESIDNHPWTIVERRIGVTDQFSDILSVLLVYAGTESFFTNLKADEKLPIRNGREYLLTFFKTDNKWSLIDPFYGHYFVNGKETFASLDNLKKGNWQMVDFDGKEVHESIFNDFYSKLFAVLPSENSINTTNRYERGGRASIQNPSGRFIFELRKIYKKIRQ